MAYTRFRLPRELFTSGTTSISVTLSATTLKSSFPLCSHHCTKTPKGTGIGRLLLSQVVEQNLTVCRTIHGMVYNAMKLFMEINPQLFDDCSHEYTELQNSAEQRQATRQSKWDQIAEQAKKKQVQNGQAVTGLSAKLPKANNISKADEIDPVTQDSQKRLDALKLQDESRTGRDQRGSRDYDENNSVCPAF